ncbi:ABC-F family ATP-binding cassette domain-containing protein [Aeromicrobium sp. Leaf350]|uniref:ABC-F family ATP-binding cassette domain-containing protein n=1 Tax=Aeromicrobium sp. Leaf350 TaxID=2876565 RepID=UPI001E42CB7E|nr:ABC-F family ATP-binding cassette domain-containing protein [Aeromicrobium sp. Leaf350]
MNPLIVGEGVVIDVPAKRVLDGVTVGIGEGDKIGVVGRNGDGKSTLMGALARKRELDAGRITWRRDLRVGFLDQADSLADDATVGAVVVGDRPDHEWAGDPRIRDIVAGLLGDVAWDAEIGSLSGGQRRRTALAALLAGEWDVLFLDEPTNHLDVEGIDWLARHLNAWAVRDRALAVVTHDRWFLDAVCTTTWEVHDAIVEAFEGGYAAYVLQRVERDRQASVIEGRRQNLMRKELAWLRRGAPARTSKPKFRIDAATELISNEPPPRDTVELKKMATSRLGRDVVDILDVSVSYGDKQVLDHVEWRIGPGERAGILGRNGAGKSTLLGLVTGEVLPTGGKVKRGKTVKIATLTQSLAELDAVANDRVTDVISRQRTSVVAGGKEQTPTQLLEQLGFRTGQLSTPVKDLSGGQRRRLQLLLVLLEEPNVLILDEPTNDLDTDMLAAVEDLLDTWPGTLLVVSHDRYLLERVTDHQFAVVDGHLRHLPGGVDQYLTLAGGAGAGRTESSTRPDTAGATAGAAAPARDAQQDRELRKELTRVERWIKQSDQRTKELEALMAEHASDGPRLTELATEHAEVATRLAELEDRWLEISDDLG